MSDQELPQVTSPPTFQDAEQRTWTVKLTLDLLDRVLMSTQIDLAPDNADVSAFCELLSQPRKLGGVLWACIQKQAESTGVDRESFLEAIDGKVLMDGWEAVRDAIHFFTQSRSPKTAESIRAAIDAELKMMEAGAQVIIETIKSEATDEALKKKVAEIGRHMQGEIKKALGGPVTN